MFRGQAANPVSICRGWVLNGDSLWNAALSAGCNILATDKVRDNSWAFVNSHAPFLKLKPLGPAGESGAGEAAGEVEPLRA